MVEAAARATINERCAAAFLHDVRGSMQALFSAFELLGRSARMGDANVSRVEKACDLAKRAIARHEKSTMEILALLTSQHADVAAVDLGVLVREAAHFLRNDAATKAVELQVDAAPDLIVLVARARVQTMLVGLLTAAIDHAQDGRELVIDARQSGQNALVTLSPAAGFEAPLISDPVAAPRFRAADLTLMFARQLMASSGGRLEINAAQGDNGSLVLYLPLV